ncbi:MAG: hypothetical protein ABIS67_15940, partial [Candidatus Eisenbacteria bacterium]
LFILIFLLQGSTPGEKDTAEEVIAHFKDSDVRSSISAFLAIPAAAFLLVFLSRLRAGIDDRARAARSLLVAGGAVWSAGMLVGASVLLANNIAANEDFEAAAQTLNVLYAAMWIPSVGGIAITLLGAGLAVLRTGILPRWMGLVALVVGVISLLGPGGFLGFFVAPIWIAAAGLMLYLRRAAPVESEVGRNMV